MKPWHRKDCPGFTIRFISFSFVSCFMFTGAGNTAPHVDETFCLVNSILSDRLFHVFCLFLCWAGFCPPYKVVYARRSIKLLSLKNFSL